MPRVLVTGGAGFIGSALVRRLLAHGDFTVTVLDKLSYAGSMASLMSVAGDARFRFVHGDVADAQTVRTLIHDTQPDLIYHLAAESHVDRSIDAPAAFVTTNIVGTFTLLEAALEYWRTLDAAARERFRLVHVSTDEVFGSAPEGTVFRADSPYRPSSPYAASKAAADHLVRAWYHTWGLPAIVTTSANNYGPFQHPEKLIPNTIIRALAGAMIPVYGTGQNRRNWLHVDDHAGALVHAAALGVPGATYLFGARTEHRNVDLVGEICDALDALDAIHPDPAGSYARLIASCPTAQGAILVMRSIHRGRSENFDGGRRCPGRMDCGLRSSGIC